MPTIVDFLTIVQEALAVFGDVFDTEAARRHFAEYLTGLIVAENKPVSGINRACVITTDPSCLHRWLTAVAWDGQALNATRLAWLQQAPQTRYSTRGVMAIDNTLVTHEGKLIEKAGWFWDHADQRHVSAHDYVISHYVCPSGAHYPAARHRSGPPSAPPAVPRPAGTGAAASDTSPALAVGASPSRDPGSPQRSSPTLKRCGGHKTV
jgi:hypothetical protein